MYGELIITVYFGFLSHMGDKIKNIHNEGSQLK